MAWLLLFGLSLAMAAPFYYTMRHLKRPPEQRDVVLMGAALIFSVVFVWGAIDLWLGPVR